MITKREQIAIDTTVYGDHTADPVSGLEMSVKPVPTRTIIKHETPMSLIWPQADLGPRPVTISGTILFYETSVAAFMADVGNATAGERKLYFFDGQVESYVYVGTGQVLSRTRWGGGASAEFELVAFEFVATRTPIYDASTNAIRYGGS
jgi:hypothetical protein